MRKKDKKEQKRNEIQHRGNTNELSRNYDLLMKQARRQPRLYYSEEGGVREVK